MIVTARQLEDLHKSNGGNGHVTLPYRARLSPLASDWIRARHIVVEYSDASGVVGGKGAGAGMPLAASRTVDVPDDRPGTSLIREAASGVSSSVPFLWWCD